MVRPNYNLIRLIRRCIQQMKAEYGGSITVYRLTSVDTDLQTGAKTVTRESIFVERAVVLPCVLSRFRVQTISVISANKQIVQGGTYDPGMRTFIIDRNDVPSWELQKDDWIVYDSKRYELKTIEEYEYKTAWVIVAKEVEGMASQQDHYVTASDLIGLSDSTQEA